MLEALLVRIVLDRGWMFGQKLIPTRLEFSGTRTSRLLFQGAKERIPLIGRDTRGKSQLHDLCDPEALFDAFGEFLWGVEVASLKMQLSTATGHHLQRLPPVDETGSSNGGHIHADERGFVGEDFDPTTPTTEATDAPPFPLTHARGDTDYDEEPEHAVASGADEDDTHQSHHGTEQQRDRKRPLLLEPKTSDRFLGRSTIRVRRLLHSAIRTARIVPSNTTRVYRAPFRSHRDRSA